MRDDLKIAIFGGTGFLGNNLKQFFSNSHITYYSVREEKTAKNSHEFQFEFDDLYNFQESIFSNVDVVINCIALSNVDKCESNPNVAFKLNVILPRFLANLCSKYQVKFIHISTDHFEGLPGKPHSEFDETKSINVYSETKLRGEKEVLNYYSSAIIARTNFFGRDHIKNNSLSDWLISNLNNKISVEGYTNIFFNPVSIEFLAMALIELIKINYSGIINISSDQCISKYDFLTKIARNMKYPDYLIKPTLYELKSKAISRPNYMCLDNTNLKQITGINIPSLDDMISKTFAENSDGI